MAEADPDVLDGASCTATLDEAAQTLTFEHRGWGATYEQKARSPLVVPLGAIGSVEYERKRFSSWFRVVPRGHDAWDESTHLNPHGLTCSVDPTEFAERVKAAVSKAARADYAYLQDDELPTPPPSGWRARLAKGAARAVVDGFFNTR
jgi:hypothetical protein